MAGKLSNYTACCELFYRCHQSESAFGIFGHQDHASRCDLVEIAAKTFFIHSRQGVLLLPGATIFAIKNISVLNSNKFLRFPKAFWLFKNAHMRYKKSYLSSLSLTLNRNLPDHSLQPGIAICLTYPIF